MGGNDFLVVGVGMWRFSCFKGANVLELSVKYVFISIIMIQLIFLLY